MRNRFAESQAHLNLVTNPVYDELKTRVTRNLTKREKEKETGVKEPDPPKAIKATNALLPRASSNTITIQTPAK